MLACHSTKKISAYPLNTKTYLMKVSTFLTRGSLAKSGVLLCLLTLIAACSYTNKSNLPTPAPAPCALPSTISYQTDVLPILKEDCYSCHDAAHYQNSPPNGSGGELNMENFKQLQSYSLAANGRNGTAKLVGAVRRDPGFEGMPFEKAKIDRCKIAVLEAWAAAGAPAQ